MAEQVFKVAGMTCGHCVASVTEEVGEVPGVVAVDVELSSGVLTVTGDEINPEAVEAAVRDAGYEIDAKQ